MGLTKVDTRLFTCEYEYMLFNDLTNSIDNGVELIDTVYVASGLLDSKRLVDMDLARQNNYKIMYTELYKRVNNLCDWKLITVSNKQVDLVKNVLKRLQGLIKVEEK